MPLIFMLIVVEDKTLHIRKEPEAVMHNIVKDVC